MLRLLKRLAGFAVIAFLILVVVNTIDSELNSTTLEWLQPTVLESPVTENGFYLLRGIDAPAQANAFEVGHARVMVTRECARRAREESDWEAEANCAVPALNLQQLTSLRNQCDNTTSLLLCVVHDADIGTWRNAINIPPHITTRIDRLLDLDYFRVPSDGIQPSSVSTDQFDVTRLQVVRAAVSFVDDDTDAAFDRLLALEVWTRSLLRQSESYLERIVATANLAITLSALDALELVARQRGQQIKIDYTLLSKEEMDWSRTMRGEARWVARLMHEQTLTNSINPNQGYWERLINWLERRFLLPNTLLNEMVVKAQARMTYFNAPRTDYLMLRREALDGDIKSFSLRDLRNVLGYFTARMIPESTYAAYSDELRLIDQRLWLLNVRQDLWGANVAPESIESALSNFGAAAYNPYTGKQVRWDTDAAQLVIDVPTDIVAEGYLAVDYSLTTDCGR